MFAALFIAFCFYVYFIMSDVNGFTTFAFLLWTLITVLVYKSLCYAVDIFTFALRGTSTDKAE